MTALRRLIVALLVALSAAIGYLVLRFALPLAIAWLWSRAAGAGAGAAAASVSQAEILAIALLAFGAALLWQVRFQTKG